VSIFFNKRLFKTFDIRRIGLPPASLAGRIGCVRIANSRIDITVIAAYFLPPATTNGRKVATKGNHLIADTMEKMILQAPTRSTPIFGTDLNDQLGKPMENVGLDNIDNIGTVNQGQEGASGSLMRKILHNTEMAAANTFFDDCENTYIGPTEFKSRIDFIGLPVSLLDNVTKCKTLLGLARKIQSFNTRRIVDHVPISCEVKMASSSGKAHTQTARLDRDAVMKSLMHGNGRIDFCNKVYKDVEACEEYAEHIRSGAPDKAWKVIVEATIKRAHGDFGIDKWKDENYEPMKKQRDELLAERKKLRIKCGQSIVGATSCQRNCQRISAGHSGCLSEPIFPNISNTSGSWSVKFGPRGEGLSEGEEDALQDIEMQLSLVTFRLRKLNRKHNAEVRQQRILELWQAKHQRQYAVVWRLLHKLAGKGNGPKKRNYARNTTGQASHEEWKSFLKKPAIEGGLGGVIVDFKKVRQEEIDIRVEDNKKPHDMNNVMHAQDDYLRICKYLRKAPKRRASPEWSVPSEIWLQLLLPSYRPSKTLGIGASTVPDKFHSFRVAFIQLLTQIRRTELTPIDWVVSRGWQIPKNNGKLGVKAERTMHGFCPISKAFYGGMLDRAKNKHTHTPHFNHGYKSSRCREDAIAIQEIGTWRLNQIGISHTIDSHDGTNAFQCTHPDALIDASRLLYEEKDIELNKLRFDLATTRIDIQGTEVVIMPTTGNLQGFPNASKEFEVAYDFGIQRFQAKLERLNFPLHDAMHTTTPGSTETVDLSICIYADDVTTKIFCKDNNPGLLANRSKIAGKWLTQALGVDGYSMNDEKRESLIVSHGRGSKFVEREIFEKKKWPEGRAVHVLRVLGGQIDSSLSVGPELRHRLQAGRVGWYMMGKI